MSVLESTSLYRHFSADGRLLYVGISLSWPTRTKDHARGSHWFDQVAKVEIERFSSRKAALLAERDAIKAEKPKFNVMHNRQTSDAGCKIDTFGRVLSELGIKRAPADMAFNLRASCRLIDADKLVEAACAAKAQHPHCKTGMWLAFWREAHVNTGRLSPKRKSSSDPLLRKITGPDAIIGPALIYGGDQISVMIAHGVAGSPGKLVEIVLGEYFGELPVWASACASVLMIRNANQITMEEALDVRLDLIGKLRAHLPCVQTFDTDLAFAVANASIFPSERSRRLLDDVATEKAAG